MENGHKALQENVKYLVKRNERELVRLREDIVHKLEWHNRNVAEAIEGLKDPERKPDHAYIGNSSLGRDIDEACAKYSVLAEQTAALSSALSEAK
jgi:hypothetical protein